MRRRILRGGAHYIKKHLARIAALKSLVHQINDRFLRSC